MSNPFNPFQTLSLLRFPPGAQEKLCKLLMFKHLQSFSFLYSPILVTFGHTFSTSLSPNKEAPMQRGCRWGWATLMATIPWEVDGQTVE